MSNVNEEVSITIRFTLEEFERVKQALAEISKHIDELRAKGIQIPELRDVMRKLEDATRQVRDTTKQTSRSVDELAKKYGALGPKEAEISRAADELTKRWRSKLRTSGQLEEALGRVTRAIAENQLATERNRILMTAAANAWRMSSEDLSHFARALGVSERELLAYSIAQERANYNNMVFATLMRYQRASLSVGARVIHMYAMEWYWTALGAMFVSMSFARLTGSQARAQAGALTLTRAYRQVYEAQKKLREVTMEYGATSEEAKEASERLREAEINLRIVREQVRASLIQERLAVVMLYAGAIPVMINAYRMVTDIVSLMNAARLTSIQLRIQEAIANQTGATSEMQLAKVKGITAVATLLETGAISKDTAGKIVNQIATMGVTKANIAAAFSFGFLKAAIGLGITAVATMLILWGIYQSAVADANKQMEEFERRARATTATLTTHSLDDSLARVSQLTKQFAASTREARLELESVTLHSRAVEAHLYPPVNVQVVVSPREQVKWNRVVRNIEDYIVREVSKAVRTR